MTLWSDAGGTPRYWLWALDVTGWIHRRFGLPWDKHRTEPDWTWRLYLWTVERASAATDWGIDDTRTTTKEQP